jgi:hypothetical protein
MLRWSRQYSVVRTSFVITGAPLESEVDIWVEDTYSLHYPPPVRIIIIIIIIIIKYCT